MKLADFGPFVIFTAVYAAGTLGLPQFTLFAYQVRVGEMATAFVALFGMPAVFGLTLGQFIADLGVEASPVAYISPIVSFIGLLIVYYTKKYSTLAGCFVYVLLTAIWLSYLLPVTGKAPESQALYSAFAAQFVAVMVGYLAYLLIRRTVARPTANA